jgi:hypothetical protein
MKLIERCDASHPDEANWIEHTLQGIKTEKNRTHEATKN